MSENHSMEEAESLTFAAYDALENDEYERALELSAQLRAMEYSSCFVIEGLVYRQRGEFEAALERLEEATRNVPDLWILWQLKGDTLFDLERFDEAFEAFDHALALEDEDAEVFELRLNSATALWRAKRFDQALRQIAETDDSIDEASLLMRWRLEGVRVSLWSELERCEEVETRAAQLWDEQIDLEIDEDEAPDFAIALAHIGWALFYCQNSEGARKWVNVALEVDEDNAQAQLLLGQINLQRP